MITLARKKNKSPEEVLELYSLIDKAVAEKNFIDLFLAFEPLVNKCANYAYDYFRNFNLCCTVHSSDFKQDGFVMFMELCEEYDPSISQFSFFIKRMLLQKMLNHKKYKYIKKESCEPINNYIDIKQDLPTQVLLKCFIEDFPSLLAQIADRKVKSNAVVNVKEVLEMFFLQGVDITTIAKTQNVTYHAVHEHISRTQLKLVDLVNKYKYTPLIVGTTDLTYNIRKMPQGHFNIY